jgi:hypothetical protein
MGYRNQSRDYFQASSCSLTTTKAKVKTSKKEKTKTTESMNVDIHLEHRASSSQGKHEGEPSLGLCDRLDRTRDNSQRQLPTDHDYAVPTREYQTDQSSLKTAPTPARSVFGKRNANHQNKPIDLAQLTRSLHIRWDEKAGLQRDALSSQLSTRWERGRQGDRR